jgi:large subunit ribosomal protein L10
MASKKVLDKKKQLVKELKEKIDSANALVISEYRGITVKDITELRRKLFAERSEFKVVKNTLLGRALAEAGFGKLKDHLSGPIGVLLGYEDPVAPVKTLVNFIAEIEKGEIKAGVVEKVVVDKGRIGDLAKLPTREELLAKVVGGLQSPIYGLVNCLQGNIRKLVYALNAVREKKEKE